MIPLDYCEHSTKLRESIIAKYSGSFGEIISLQPCCLILVIDLDDKLQRFRESFKPLNLTGESDSDSEIESD